MHSPLQFDIPLFENNLEQQVLDFFNIHLYLEERPVIEYQFQQYRLFPFLAASYVIELFRKWLLDTYQDYMQSVIRDKPVSEELSAELHAITSASKPFAGWLARDAIQTVGESKRDLL